MNMTSYGRKPTSSGLDGPPTVGEQEVLGRASRVYVTSADTSTRL